MPEQPDDATPVIPSFWGALLVLWAVAEGTAAAMLLFSAARGHWPLATGSLVDTIGWLRVGSFLSAIGLIPIALWFLLMPMALVGLWQERRRPGLVFFGVLLVLGWGAKQANWGDHYVRGVAWLMIGAGAAGVARIVGRAAPRASWPLLAVVALAVVAGRMAAVALLAAFVQMAWTFVSSRRVLVKRRDTQGRLDLRRRARDRLELAAVVLFAAAWPIAHGIVRRHQPPTPESLLAGIPFDIGIALVVLSLLLQDRRFPAQIPRTRAGWLYEVAFGVWLWSLAGAVEGAVFALAAWLPSGPDYWTNLDYSPALRTVLVFESFFNSLREEMIFRSFLVTRLWPRVGNAWAVVISSALFALAHGYSARGLATTFAYGVVMAIVWVKTRSFMRLWIAHWISNAVGFSLSH
jgi:membrane protease YdiL (CAAX protease family)